jgi:hypothetical protein
VEGVIKMTGGNDVYCNCEHMMSVATYVNVGGIVVGEYITLRSLGFPHLF